VSILFTDFCDVTACGMVERYLLCHREGWRWRQQIPLKCCYLPTTTTYLPTYQLHIPQITVIFRNKQNLWLVNLKGRNNFGAYI